MRVAAVVRPGISVREVRAFHKEPGIVWQEGLPVHREDADAVMIFGGDGTVHRHLPDLVKLKLPVLVVPHGSGNDFARAMGLMDWRDSLEAWRSYASGAGNAWAIDLGTITDSQEVKHYFGTVAGVGLDGAVLRQANRLPRLLRGNGGYVLSLLLVLWRFRAVNMRLKLESTEKSGPIILAAFANAAAYGGGMKIAPKACLDDGQLEVCLIHEISRLKLAAVFPRVYSGGHLGIREFGYQQAARVRIETDVPWDLNADGEYVCKTPAEIGVEPGALRVIVPSGKSKP